MSKLNKEGRKKLFRGLARAAAARLFGLYTDADMTSFGNYLLSDVRRLRTTETNRSNVTHADWSNWRYETQNNDL